MYIGLRFLHPPERSDASESPCLSQSPRKVTSYVMPFLRGLSGDRASVELRSSKTLVGSSRAKCDVVMPAERGVLELHALLNLSSTKSEATLVPFTSTADGACFLNGRVVPAKGATVVHGDRIAFGNADNTFVFTLTEQSLGPDQQQRSRSFRRALDALRGDRAPEVAVKANAATADGPRNMNSSASVGGSKERLEKLLLDASTDSLLGDYVERQLRKSHLRRERVRPTAMEPPPSLSASTVSSIQSTLTDSILDRSAQLQSAPAQKSDPVAILTASQSLLSTAERNYAEIEKLRLSQRLREVNNVLNGQLDFRSSYLSTERRSSGSQSMRWSSPVKQDMHGQKDDSAVEDNLEDDGEEVEEEDDELPAMVEKPQLKQPRSPHHSPVEKPTGTLMARSTHPSPRSKVSISVASSPRATQVSPSSPDDSTAEALDESLPSFSEAIQKPRISTQLTASTPRHATESCEPQVSSKAAASASDVMPKQRATRTQLHQQLIDCTLRRKRQEMLVEAFMRWRQGIRVQEQRRRAKTRQLQVIDKKLRILRRNHSFVGWRRLAEQRQQVVQCREEAFAQRRSFRLLRDVWTRWIMALLSDRRERSMVKRLVLLYAASRLRTGLSRWRRTSDTLRTYAIHRDAQQRQEEAVELRMDVIATRHHQKRSTAVCTRKIFHAWRELSRRERIKSQAMRRMLQHVYRRRQLRAWTTWRQHTVMHRHASDAAVRHQRAVEEVEQKVTQRHRATQGQMQDLHDKQVSELQATIEQQTQQLGIVKQEQHERERRLREARVVADTRWQRGVEKFLESTIAQADTRIATVSAKLEHWLQRMDDDPQGARFQCASFLVEAMMEQKLRNANELVETKAKLAAIITIDTNEKARRASGREVLPGNIKFLLGMVQQRHARLHQLHQAVAKLSASVPQPALGGTVQLDPVKFKHATFLTDTMKDRMTSHLETVLEVQRRYRELDGVDDHTEAREARKY